jgi:addiction module HigA family antidote
MPYRAPSIAGPANFSVADRSWIITERRAAMAKKLPPVHPGEVLREEFLRPLNLSPYAVARAVGVPRTRIERLANEQTPVTADTALRLGRYFGTSAAFWMGIQTQYDLERAEDELGATLRKIAPAREAKPAA